MKPDTMDRRLIGLLNQNGRVTNKELAVRLRVSEGTVRNRIRKLTANGKLRVSGLINPDDSPDKQLMLLGITIACSRDLSKKAAEIARLVGVQSVSITAGRYDMIAEIWVDAKGGLIDFLSTRLSRIRGIASTESFLVMKSYNKWIAEPHL